MRTPWTGLGDVDPKALVAARLEAHHAAQWVTRAARANLEAAADDSHSNLGWDRAELAFLSHDLRAENRGICRAGLWPGRMTLFVVKAGRSLGEFELAGRSDAEAGRWIDRLATDAGLRRPSDAVLPYEIPDHPVAHGAPYSDAALGPASAVLARWYDAAEDVLQEIKARLAAVKPGPSAVRCWPHHFDSATLLRLREGDPETAPSIGIGMSPGDEYYAEPYFYVAPSPAPAVASLPALPAPGHWHERDFTGAIATAGAVLTLGDRRAGLLKFIEAAVEISRRALGA